MTFSSGFIILFYNAGLEYLIRKYKQISGISGQVAGKD
jgi:hypothetical protein